MPKPYTQLIQHVRFVQTFVLFLNRIFLFALVPTVLHHFLGVPQDKQFGKVQLYFPHENPKAEVETQIKPYKTYTLQRAYKGESYFWGLLPQQGDLLQFTFDPPVVIKG